MCTGISAGFSHTIQLEGIQVRYTHSGEAGRMKSTLGGGESQSSQGHPGGNFVTPAPAPPPLWPHLARHILLPCQIHPGHPGGGGGASLASLMTSPKPVPAPKNKPRRILWKFSRRLGLFPCFDEYGTTSAQRPASVCDAGRVLSRRCTNVSACGARKTWEIRSGSCC